MKIEILTRDVEKKAEIITFLRNLKGFDASGGVVCAVGVRAEIAQGYILLTVALPWLADELVKGLFTVRPVPFAASFYEIAGDPRVIITCAAQPVIRIMPQLDIIEHLDVEAGELAGRFETRWTSRDVDLAAGYEVMVQGGVAVARVKFNSHFRETEQHCREVLAMAGLTPGLAVFSAGDGEMSRPAGVSAVLLTAAAQADEAACANFLNRCPGRLEFDVEKGAYQLDLPGAGNRVTISGKNGKSAGVSVVMETPWLLEVETLDLLGDLLEAGEVEVGGEITGLTLAPEDLLRRLGFVKEKEFLVFSARQGLIAARYDIGRRSMKIAALIPWGEAGGSSDLFGRIKEFMARVMEFAV